MNKQVRLVEVQGDQEEFADLIGAEGELQLIGPASPHNWFNAKNRGDSLELVVKTVDETPGKITVHTELSNSFTFRILEKK